MLAFPIRDWPEPDLHTFNWLAAKILLPLGIYKQCPGCEGKYFLSKNLKL